MLIKVRSPEREETAMGGLIRASDLPRVACATKLAIIRTFAEDGVDWRQQTQASIKMRADAAEKILRMLLGEKKWGLDRALAQLYEYLRLEVRGIPWEPASRTLWVPDDGAVITN